MKEIKHRSSVRCVKVMNIKIIFCTEAKGRVLSHGLVGRSCLPTEDHNKSSAGSREFISCAPCPCLA